ncbi:MAG: pyruvate formate lyase family protein, partial [Opitutaceae bacterium]
MKCLPAFSLEAAIAGSPFAPLYPTPLSLELAITEAYRFHENDHPALRELAVLRIQFSAMMQPIGEQDLLAGRVFYPLVSFGPEVNQPGGLGYACGPDVIREMLKRPDVTPELAARAEEMIAFWSSRSTEARTRAAYPPELAKTLPSDAWMAESGIAFPLYRIAGTVLDYAKLMRVGLPGLIAEARSLGGRADAEGALFFKGVVGALELLATSCKNYALQASELAARAKNPQRRSELLRIAGSLEAIQSRPPQSLHEGIQLAWLYALHSGTWNYGRADVYLGPLLDADIKAGRLDEPEALRLIQSWWRLMKAYANPFNNRVFIGGRGRPDEAASDRFALLAMEASRTLRLDQPQLSLRFYEGQNPDLMEKALTVIGEGVTYPMLYNDDVNIPAVARSFAIPEDEAVRYHPFGCGEYIIAARSIGSPNGVINLAKCLEATLHEGRDPWTGKRTGPATPPVEAFDSFEQLWAAYAAQVEHHVAACAQQEKIEYEVAGRETAFLFISALYDDCFERARPLLSGGVKYLGGTIETYGNITTADSLRAIEELVF